MGCALINYDWRLIWSQLLNHQKQIRARLETTQGVSGDTQKMLQVSTFFRLLGKKWAGRARADIVHSYTIFLCRFGGETWWSIQRSNYEYQGSSSWVTNSTTCPKAYRAWQDWLGRGLKEHNSQICQKSHFPVSGRPSFVPFQWIWNWN